MAHVQKPDIIFRRNGRVHLNRRGRQFSRLLAAEVCASAVVMLDTPCSEEVREYWLPTPFASFPFTSPSLRHRLPSHFNWTLPTELVPKQNTRQVPTELVQRQAPSQVRTAFQPDLLILWQPSSPKSLIHKKRMVHYQLPGIFTSYGNDSSKNMPLHISLFLALRIT
jgi:hypothetical protein